MPALLQQTSACRSASLWTASSSARQTAHLSASMSTTATKHLPGCVHKAGLSFAKIPNWDGLSRQMSEPKWTKSKLRQTFQRLSSTTEGWAKIGQPTAQSFTRNNRKQKNAFIHKGRKRNFRGTTFVSALQSSEQTLSAVTGLPDKAY